MNANFVDGDLLVRLDFYKHPVQDSKEMQQCMKKAIRKLRALFKKNNKQLKYIYVKELGPRGSRHIHMVISKCSLDDLQEAWSHGGIHVDPLTFHTLCIASIRNIITHYKKIFISVFSVRILFT